jgi:hypothetical protein
VGFAMVKVALWQVFSEYLGFPCMSMFIPPITITYHLGLVQ